MSIDRDHPDTGPVLGDPDVAATPAERLRTKMAASRVQFTWLGTQKSLSRAQRATAAEPFDADGASLSAAKKLLDTAHPAFRAVTAVRTRVVDRWRDLSLPFPEPAIRLLRREDVSPFAAAMAGHRVELAQAVAALDRDYAELRDAAAARLGSLFDPADYPESLVGLFDVAWDFPSVEPPGYLLRLAPAVYAEERARTAARFEEAARLAEAAFVEEFARLVDHLAERLDGTDADGAPKVFRESAVGNLSEFFARFRMLDVGSNAELDALVERARRLVRGVGARDLRETPPVRTRVATGMARIRDSLDAMLVDRPRRRVLRRAEPAGAVS